MGFIGKLMAAQRAKRKRTVNKQSRVDELRLVLAAMQEHRILHRNVAGRWVGAQANTHHVLGLVRIPGTSDVLAPSGAPEPESSTGSDAVVFENSSLG